MRQLDERKKTSKGPGKGKKYVSTSIDQELRDLIDRRARSLEYSRGKYTREIIEWWKKQGYPPVSEVDRIVQKNKE